MCLCWFWMVLPPMNFIEADWKAERLAVRSSFWWPEAVRSRNKQAPYERWWLMSTWPCLWWSCCSSGGDLLEKPIALRPSTKLIKEGFEFKYKTLEHIYENMVEYGKAIGILHNWCDADRSSVCALDLPVLWSIASRRRKRPNNCGWFEVWT
jgi:hypothetical protein